MTLRTLRVLFIVVFSFSTFAFLVGFSGCKTKSLISGVSYKVEPNLETIKVQLNFSDDIESDLGGSFDVKDYGTLEVEPSMPGQPFNVGFRLNLAIVNDQDYVRLDPVQDLPSGQPLPIVINRALAQIKMKNEINPNFDIYAYVDIAGKEWLGAAVTLKFINNKYFPAGLSVSKQFLKDSQGLARAAAAVFGPKLDEQGNMVVPGGIAIFANVKALIDSARNGGKKEGTDKGSKLVLFDGFNAPYYRAHPREAVKLEQAFKTLLNANAFGGSLL